MKQNQIALEGIGLQLGYSQDGVRKPLLENLNFELVAGELTCLLGPNGVGKSTLIKAILGEISPWEGRLLLEQAPPILLFHSRSCKAHRSGLNGSDLSRKPDRWTVCGLGQNAAYKLVGEIVR